MKLILVLAGFAAMIVWGWARTESAGGKGAEKALYTTIVVISAYIAVAGLRSWPVWTPVRIFRTVFIPLGRWLEWLLGTV